MYELLQDFMTSYQSRSEYFLGALVTTRTEEGSAVPYQVRQQHQKELQDMVPLPPSTNRCGALSSA